MGDNIVDSFGVVLLAAGKGTRLKIDIAKPLCPALGKPLLDYVLDELEVFEEKESIDMSFGLVVGHQKEKVQAHLESRERNYNFAWQKEQLGTGHALQTYFNKVNGAWDKEYTLVVCADTPLITHNTYLGLLNSIKENNAEAVCATFNLKKPLGYGRIKKADKGFSIVEEKDASSEEREITEVNSGLYIFRTKYLEKHINNLGSNNKSNEFYITDLFKSGANVITKLFEDSKEFIGVNNLIQLEEVSQVLQERVVKSLQLDGVRFLNSSNVYIEPSVKIGTGSVVYPGVILKGSSNFGQNCVIENGVTTKNSKFHNDVCLKANTYVENSEVYSNVSIGPMAHIRPGSVIGENSKIGNFVELKKSTLAEGVKVSHLSYVGDAEIGPETNIGCGFITCNYDGTSKHKTIIGKNSFIGSDCQMIAPISIGDECYVGSGSTINRDVPSGAFAIARERQINKPNMAKKFIKKKK